MSLSMAIKKRYPGFTLDVALEAGEERVALLGASGCGKSLTLRCIAGVETEAAAGLDPGEILLLGPGGNTAVRLGADGRISITGRVSINGVELPGTYQPQAGPGDGS